MSWPDGQPVTPWADPWHDVKADIAQIGETSMWNEPDPDDDEAPPPEPKDDDWPPKPPPDEPA